MISKLSQCKANGVRQINFFLFNMRRLLKCGVFPDLRYNSLKFSKCLSSFVLVKTTLKYCLMCFVGVDVAQCPVLRLRGREVTNGHWHPTVPRGPG